jgi:hypothetical protein
MMKIHGYLCLTMMKIHGSLLGSPDETWTIAEICLKYLTKKFLIFLKLNELVRNGCHLETQPSKTWVLLTLSTIIFFMSFLAEIESA